MNLPITTAGEIQARIKSGARLTDRGWEWSKVPRIAIKQIQAFSFIRGLQAHVQALRAFNAILV